MKRKQELWYSFNGYSNRNVMLRICILCTCLVALSCTVMAQAVAAPGRSARQHRGIGKRDNYEEFRTPASVNRAPGYVVYNDDTIRGIISFNKFEIYIEQPINQEYSYYYHFMQNNLHLKTLVVYNIDKKQLCLTRVKHSSTRLMRLIHEGRLSIYDDRLSYVYDPTQVDRNLIVVSYNGHVKELGSFFAAGTKRKVVNYVNNAYNLHLNPKDISWQDLLVKVDGLE